ncbi:MarR family winged helix-turn-helix transcriptional regulator [Nonomuraea sp. CA-141351]|uniref:MarR family winged helix-turn-helix transcriptional regulator n=1 Tax=Nonomuraea sp. CA-141351 TaxID=3239996 RepID=UPI003D8ABEF1
MSETRWLNETEMRAWTGFLETTDRIHRLVELQLREAGGLTMVQYEILHWTNERSAEPVCMTELVELMIGSRSGLSYQVSQLEKAGLVRRGPSPDDERRVLVTITDEGRRILEKAAPGHVQTVREGLIDMLTPEQIEQLAEIMEVTRDHLRSAVQLTPRHKRNTR